MADAIDSFKGPFNMGPLAIYAGSYVHTAGAADLTFTIGSQKVLAIVISSLDSGGKVSSNLGKFTESLSGSTRTITVSGPETVAEGYILVFALAG